MTMAGAATMLGIGGKNAARTWQRYETGERAPPLELLVRMEMISEGQVTAGAWLQVRQAYLSRLSEEAKP